MMLPLVTALLCTLATLVLAVPLAIVQRWRRRPQATFWRAVLWLHLALFLVHSLLTFPALLGWFASRQLGTRPQERTYAGPRLAADGTMLVQSWASLQKEAELGAVEVNTDVVAAARARERRVLSTDGVTLRTFRIEAAQEPPVAVAVLVHGLFRSAMELEPVAAMLHAQGCECWLVELRNHGGSSRAPFTGGARESDDVVAAVGYVRAQPGRSTTPLVLFGVSLGTVAVSMALPRIDGVAGLVLDAPIDDLSAAAHRMLSFRRENDRRSWFAIVEPWRSTVLISLEQWSGFRTSDVSPGEVLANLPHDLPVLMVGAGQDDRAPPYTVERLFSRLPMPATVKELWMVPEAPHGQVFVAQAQQYAAHLQQLLGRLRR